MTQCVIELHAHYIGRLVQFQKHVLLDCADFNPLRNLFYSVNALEEINKVKPDAVLEFLAKIDCKIHLYIVLQKIATEAGMQFKTNIQLHKLVQFQPGLASVKSS